MQQDALIVNVGYANRYITKACNDLGTELIAVSPNKNTQYVVGDVVVLVPIDNKLWQVVDLKKPRHNIMMRSNVSRQKLIASNIDQVLITVSVIPTANRKLLNAILIQTLSMNASPIIVINKDDLVESKLFIQEMLDLYRTQLGIEVLTLNTLSVDNIQPLKDKLQGKQNLLIGQSGVGKSSIINLLIANANTRVGSINKTQTTGCHTTTSTFLYHLNNNSTIIDCPGLEEFGLDHLKDQRIFDYFVELNGQKCKFRDCRHTKQDDCIINALYKSGKIDHDRYLLLLDLFR